MNTYTLIGPHKNPIFGSQSRRLRCYRLKKYGRIKVTSQPVKKLIHIAIPRVWERKRFDGISPATVHEGVIENEYDASTNASTAPRVSLFSGAAAETIVTANIQNAATAVPEIQIGRLPKLHMAVDSAGTLR